MADTVEEIVGWIMMTLFSPFGVILIVVVGLALGSLWERIKKWERTP